MRRLTFAVAILLLVVLLFAVVALFQESVARQSSRLAVLAILVSLAAGMHLSWLWETATRRMWWM